MGYTRYKTLIMNYLQIFFTNKWHKGHHRITPNSGRAIILSLVIIVIFIVIDWFSTIKLQKYNEITNFLQTFLIPSSGYKEEFELNQVLPFNKYIFQEARKVGYELKKTRWFDEVFENLKIMDRKGLWWVGSHREGIWSTTLFYNWSCACDYPNRKHPTLHFRV